MFLTIWLIRTMFGEWEAEHLASIGRYFNVAYYPFFFFGLLFFTLNLFLLLDKKFNNWMWLKNNSFLFNWSVYSFGIILIGLGLSLAHNNYQNLKKIPHDEISSKLEVLMDEIKRKNLTNPSVNIIAQGTNTTEIVKIRFYARQYQNTTIELLGGRSLGPINTNIWSVAQSDEDTRKQYLSSDVLWIEKTDEYIDNILEKIIDISTCKRDYKNYFLFKNTSGQFECGILHNASVSSCDTLYHDKGKMSGTHEIDVDGNGPRSPITLRCKMENGKGWTLVAKINSKNAEHAQEKAVRPNDFYKKSQYGKLSDDTINKLAKFSEFRLECGKGKFKEVFIKDHSWRSYVNSTHYKGLYSIDQKQWFAFNERGVPHWHGFDNYEAASKNNHYSWFFAYDRGTGGCYSQSHGDKPADGALWVR